jgi:hypothetical protein
LAAILFSNYLYAAEAQKPRIVEVFPLDYPADAKKLGHQGTVVVEVKILTNDTISTPVIKKVHAHRYLTKPQSQLFNKLNLHMALIMMETLSTQL